MKELSERQKVAFEEIKRKKRNGKEFSDWEKKLIYDLDLDTELASLEIETKVLKKDCLVCQGAEEFSFRRLIDDFQTFRDVLINLKGTNWSFACPACNGQNKDIRPIEPALLENAGWLFLNNHLDKERLEKFFFFYEGDLST